MEGRVIHVQSRGSSTMLTIKEDLSNGPKTVEDLVAHLKARTGGKASWKELMVSASNDQTITLPIKHYSYYYCSII